MSSRRRRTRSQSSTPTASPRTFPTSTSSPFAKCTGLWAEPTKSPMAQSIPPQAATSAPATPSLTSCILDFFPQNSIPSTSNHRIFAVAHDGNEDDIVQLHREAYVNLRRSVAESDEGFVLRMRDWERSRSRMAAIQGNKRRKTTKSETRSGIDDTHRIFRRSKWARSTRRRRSSFESDPESSAPDDDDDETTAHITPSHYRSTTAPPSCFGQPFDLPSSSSLWSDTPSDTDMILDDNNVNDLQFLVPQTFTPPLSIMSMSTGSSTSLPYSDAHSLLSRPYRDDKDIDDLNRAFAAGAGSLNDYEDVRKAQGELEAADAGELWN